MMTPDEERLIAQVKRLSKKLDERVKQHKKITPYIEGSCPYPPAVKAARLTKVYRYLMPVSEAPWASLITDSKLDRMEVAGLRDSDANGNEDGAKQIWRQVWQANDLDAESKLAHQAALEHGRCFGTVWPGQGDAPDIALDDCTQMVVEFAEGSRKYRTAALRRWKEGERLYATLYRKDGVYKFQSPPKSTSSASNVEWEKREVDGEEWPLDNPFDSVPVVELAVNRRLKPGPFPYARGEFEHCLGLIDRIHLLTFLGLVIAFWMGFPMRGVIGDKIRHEVLVDDDKNPIIDPATNKPKTKMVPPFDAEFGGIFQMENPEAKLAEFKEANRRNLSIYDELQQLAVVTHTARHYFPMEGGIANIGTETVAAFEGGMIAAVVGHTSGLGGGWEEICRLGGQVLPQPVELSQQAEVRWKDPEFRTLAERADAASKFKDVLPAIAVAELCLNASQEEIGRWMSMEATNPLMTLLANVKKEPDAVPAG